MFRLVLIFIFAVATTSHGRNAKFTSPSVGGRIVGGEDTAIENYPYQISLQLQNGHWCGGSLIRPNVVLTAAHCMDYPPSFYLVRAGSTIVEEGGQVAQVTDVCSHPKYNTILMNDYDVAVLKLNKPLILNSAVKLINLQQVDDEIPVNTMATVTGWGRLQFSVELPSNILQKVEVPKVDQKICQDIYWNLKRRNVTDRMTCYGYAEGGRNACKGDSGGALVASGKQIGIVSWSYECARPNVPAVFTSLENEEIQQHINNCLAKFA